MKMVRSRMRWALMALTVALFVGGCTGLPGLGTPPQLYTLTPKSTFDPNVPAVDFQLLIETPVAAAGLDSARIALAQTPTSLAYFANAAWTDRAPQMVQTLMVESFENSGKIMAVGRETLGLRADYILKTELREFQAEYYDNDTAAPRVRVRLNVKLVEMPRRSILASRNFESVVQAEGNAIGAIVRGFDTALGVVLKDVVEWSLTLGQNR